MRLLGDRAVERLNAAADRAKARRDEAIGDEWFKRHRAYGRILGATRLVFVQNRAPRWRWDPRLERATRKGVEGGAR
jgi:hypothetical protein